MSVENHKVSIISLSSTIVRPPSTVFASVSIEFILQAVVDVVGVKYVASTNDLPSAKLTQVVA